MKNRILIKSLVAFLFITTSCNATTSSSEIPLTNEQEKLVLGAERMELYLPLLEGKRVGAVVNPTSRVGGVHLVDTLVARDVDFRAVFAPEHGFRGEAADGERIDDMVDLETGVEIRSVYGKTRKPTKEMLVDLDIILFDIQDVGTRFYTFISTMHYVMEAAAEKGIPFIVLDRPNPNGNYVDGPIREEGLKTFVGMHPIPIVHGLTVCELAQMINGEGWMENGIKADLTVIEMTGYKHSDEYELPMKPSPNLPDQASIILYPSLCLIEGTVISEGRGTYKPFTQIGHPSFKGIYEHSFTPVPIPGMSNFPKHANEECYGIDFGKVDVKREFTLKYLIEFYNNFEDKENFFKKGIDRLAGTTKLKEQIIAGISEADIRASWEPGLSEYKEMRKKYLIYPL